MDTIQQNDSTINRPEGERVLNAPLVHIDMGKFYRQIRNEPAWEKSERNAITLLHNDRLRIVLIALKAEGEIPTHSVDGPCSIQVWEGRIWVETEEQSISVAAGEAIAIEAQVPHIVYAEEESMHILTLAGDADGNF